MHDVIAFVLVLGLFVLMVWRAIQRFKKENGAVLHVGKKIAITVLEVPIFFILSSLILSLSGSAVFCESSYSCNGSGIILFGSVLYGIPLAIIYLAISAFIPTSTSNGHKNIPWWVSILVIAVVLVAAWKSLSL